MMKKKNQILVTLSVVALLGGCSEDEVQRDVYNSLDDCVADWIRPELCEQDKSQSTNTSPVAGSHVANNSGNMASSENNAVVGDNSATPTTTASGDEGPSIGSAIAGAAAGAETGTGDALCRFRAIMAMSARKPAVQARRR